MSDFPGSIQDLFYSYIKTKCIYINKRIKKKIFKAIQGALNNGYTYDDINKIINDNTSNIKSIESLCRNKKNSNDINLLQQSFDKFYYHNELRILPPPPVSTYNPYTCEIEETKVDYFLEIKASYTSKDLLKYIKTKESMKHLLNNEPRLAGALKTEIKKYDIDLLLFLIDSTDAIYCNKKKYLKNLFEIDDYLEEAKQNLNMKYTESVINDTNKVVPKMRYI